MAPHTQADALRGTLDLLVLKTLTLGPRHGWGIGEAIQQVTSGVLEVNQGSLYPALQRLEHRGVIRSEWGVSENGRRARYYSLTHAGRRALGAELDSWRRFAAAVETVLLQQP
jgi:PadR family transcriptional regulator, regulatory protein PadR